jgi:hypothetical protein
VEVWILGRVIVEVWILGRVRVEGLDTWEARGLGLGAI